MVVAKKKKKVIMIVMFCNLLFYLTQTHLSPVAESFVLMITECKKQDRTVDGWK